VTRDRVFAVAGGRSVGQFPASAVATERVSRDLHREFDLSGRPFSRMRCSRIDSGISSSRTSARSLVYASFSIRGQGINSSIRRNGTCPVGWIGDLPWSGDPP
jgi:hypothetical protein